MTRWPTFVFFASVFACAVSVGVAGIVFVLQGQQPQPHNMPSQDEVRQIMLDCEQFNPGKRCIFVAMVVPDFSESLKQ